ncbi:TolC family protein [Acanthopleuribacter pedis]|uniref:TolC family protein n=1 Tax=Acanthopleuribacter pedis TaxID=442870 RepID=A0A8J7U937_9BACT|nr:TolC family protein [Acanthopleuribacter pedis]MBO1323241.1 TolC family protein [Acanthopleuribacter pedis]
MKTTASVLTLSLGFNAVPRLFMALVLVTFGGVGLFAAEPKLDLVRCIELALAHDPEIALAREDVNLAEAALQFEAGTFDYQFEVGSSTQRDRIPTADGGNTDTDTTRLNASLVKTFRSGIEFTPSLSLERRDVHHNDSSTRNSADVSLSLSYPLLRGQGRDMVTGRERAAERALTATEYRRRFRIAQRTLATINAYWRYCADLRRLEVVKESEARSTRLVKETRALIEAGETPENELLQLLANENDKRAIRIDTRNSVFQSRHNLGLVMGLTPAQIAALPAVASAFPEPAFMGEGALPESVRLVVTALEQRADLRALRLDGEADQIRYALATDGLKPDLSLNVEAGYDTLREGSGLGEWLAAVSRRTPGANYAVELSYKLPLGRKTAKSDVRREGARLEQTRLSLKDLERQIGLQVMIAYEDLQRALETLEAVDQSVGYYELAVANERKKLKLGFSTLIDLISYEDRLTSVLLRKIESQARLWQALADLQFETGSFDRMDMSALDQAAVLAFPRAETR